MFDWFSTFCGQPSKGGSPAVENLVNYAGLYQELKPPAMRADLTNFANLLMTSPVLWD